MFVLWSEAYQIFIKILNFRKTSSNGTGKNLVRRFSPIQLYILWGRGRKELGDYIYRKSASSMGEHFDLNPSLFCAG